jgi:DNA polymerase III subunit delta'
MPFSEFLGHTKIVATLRGMLANDRVPHALLFSGTRGVGKFTLARMFAQAANCERLRDDFCGECQPCRRIAGLADPRPLIEAGLAERGEGADAGTVERVPLLLETHPDVWAVVPDPVRLRTPVVRPVLRMGQLRAIQRAAYFKPAARQRLFLLDGAETMREDLAGVFLKILEEPPPTSTLILLTTSYFSLLPTIRSRCMPFFFAPLDIKLVEEILSQRTQMKPAQRRLAAQLAEGSPGAALTLNVEEAADLRRRVLQLLSDAAETRSSSALFAQTAQLAKGQKLPFESVLELFYSLLTDLLELSAGCANLKLRNPTLAKELAALGKRVDPHWVSQAVTGLDELGSRLRRNVNRQLGLDAVVLSLSLKQQAGERSPGA